MKNNKIILKSFVASIAVTLLIVYGLSYEPKAKQSAVSPSTQQYSLADIAAKNGKEGSACWVAVDGVVYEMYPSSEWQDGQHLASAGLAYCGADMSAIIDKAPHGRDKLKSLKILGSIKL